MIPGGIKVNEFASICLTLDEIWSRPPIIIKNYFLDEFSD